MASLDSSARVELACTTSIKRTLDMYLANYAVRPTCGTARAVKLAAKVAAEYASVKDARPHAPSDDPARGGAEGAEREANGEEGGALVLHRPAADMRLAHAPAPNSAAALIAQPQMGKNLLAGRRAPLKLEQPEWHAPWKLMRVISGHLGWVRSIAIDPTNEWFATGSNDRTIKIWDLASGTLKLTLTGHISAVRSLCISDRHPYIFSAGDDKMVKCWDLETNRAVRQYHGHLSGVYCMSLHPTLDVLCTGGRDSCVRVWDVRTAAPVFVLGGHTNTVSALVTQAAEPQVISGSMDSTIRLWDLAAGKSRATLTNHKKSVRALALHPTEYSFASGSADNIKKWRCPDGEFLQNLSGHTTILNSLAVNEDGVLVSAGDNGTLHFWDWRTGHCFQRQMTIAQPGSLEAEHGIYTLAFDRSGSRLLTGEADKTIKVWKEDTDATPQSHPVNYNPVKEPRRY